MYQLIDLSIIIVNYNKEDLLEKCIASIYKETKISFEIIIIDNGCNHKKIDLLSSLYDNILIKKNDINKGFSFGCNQGASIAKGKYFLFLNPDTIVLDGAIDKTYSFITSISKHAIVGCKLLNFDGTYQPSCRSFPSISNHLIESLILYRIFPKNKIIGKYYMTYMNSDDINEVDVVMGAFMMMEKDMFVALNGFDEQFFMYSEETDFCFRAKKAKYKIFYFPKANVMHKWGGMLEDLSDDLFIEMHRSLMKFCRKHHQGFYFIIEKIVVFIGVLLRALYYNIVLILNRSDSIKKKQWKYILLLKAYIQGI